MRGPLPHFLLRQCCFPLDLLPDFLPTMFTNDFLQIIALLSLPQNICFCLSWPHPINALTFYVYAIIPPGEHVVWWALKLGGVLVLVSNMPFSRFVTSLNLSFLIFEMRIILMP